MVLAILTVSVLGLAQPGVRKTLTTGRPSTAIEMMRLNTPRKWGAMLVMGREYVRAHPGVPEGKEACEVRLYLAYAAMQLDQRDESLAALTSHQRGCSDLPGSQQPLLAKQLRRVLLGESIDSVFTESIGDTISARAPSGSETSRFFERR